MEELKILQTKKCPKCGTEINGTHHRPPFYQKKLPKGFYGNNVKKTIISVCDCGEEYLSLLRPCRNSYEVVSLAKIIGGPDLEEFEPEVVPEPNADVVKDDKLKDYGTTGTFDPEKETTTVKAPKKDPVKEAVRKFERSKLEEMNRVELEQLSKEMDIKGNIYVMKDETLIKKLLSL